MANELEICNLALSRIQANAIQSLAEASREAQVCRRHYPLCRDSVLNDYDWAFARRNSLLAEIAAEHPSWEYVYALPADCIAPRRIWSVSDPEGADPRLRIPYEKGLHPTTQTLALYTNEAEARLVYTAQVTNAALFDPLFADMLAWRLASEFAQPLRGNSQLMGSMFNIYTRALAAAAADSANQSYTAPSGSGDFVAARA